MATKSTFGLCPKLLVTLLDAGSDGEDNCSQLPAPQAAAELMRRRLVSPLQITERCVDSLPDVLDRSCPEMLSIKGCPLGEILLDPNTPLAILETLKQYGKGLAARWDEGSEHVAAVTIYFAAIAAALGSHRCKITTRSYGELADSLRLLMADRWTTPELAGLFDTARTLCEAEER
ncbi:MAG: hypothetical protein QGG42_07375 [Phycisphaerae bacterium]|nr:hypothetical protein [Phycisphaerae bacterium]